MVDSLTRFRDQKPIVLGDLNADIQAQNPRSNQVADLLMEFGMVVLYHHLVNEGSDTCNVVSDAAQQIVAEKMLINIWDISAPH